jgi:hypothetical protein
MTINFIELYPKIHLYPNALENPELWIKDALEGEGHQWNDWGIYGKAFSTSQRIVIHENFPEYDQFMKNAVYQSQYPAFAEAYGKSFYENTKHWLQMHPMELNNWISSCPAICEYTVGEDQGHGDTFTMAYHSDFTIGEETWPGDKFELTATLYLNDDYDQGEICFVIKEEDGSDTRFSYKPRPGEMMVFPARPPYFHGVKRAFGKNRYIVRSFWQSRYPGDEAWHNGVKEYGEEKWNEMKQIEIHEYRQKHIPNPENYASSYNRDNERLGLNPDGTLKI